MKYLQIKAKIKNLISLREDEYLNYINQVEQYIQRKISKEYNEKLFTYYDKEDLRFDLYCKIYDALEKIHCNNLPQVLSYCKTSIDNFINNERRYLALRASKRIDKKIYNPDDEKYVDEITEISNPVDEVEENIIFNPIPNSVINKLTNIDKDVFNFILQHGDISTKAYAAYARISEITAQRRIERFRNRVSYEMSLWGEHHPDEAKLMPEVFSYIRDK